MCKTSKKNQNQKEKYATTGSYDRNKQSAHDKLMLCSKD